MFTQSAANISTFDPIRADGWKSQTCTININQSAWAMIESPKRFNGETDKRMFVQGSKASAQQKFQLKKGDLNRNNI